VVGSARLSDGKPTKTNTHNNIIVMSCFRDLRSMLLTAEYQYDTTHFLQHQAGKATSNLCIHQAHKALGLFVSKKGENLSLYDRELLRPTILDFCCLSGREKKRIAPVSFFF
jgi:hypothetical protein